MPEPLLTVGAIAVMTALARRDNGMSREARETRAAVIAVAEHVEGNAVIFGEKGRAIQALHRMVAECADDGEYAVHPASVDLTEAFIRLLPADIPIPEFAPDPDGSVSLDWHESKARVFSVSIGSGRRLPYAWLDGTEKGHGVAWFDAVSIPLRILQGIRAIVPNDSILRPTR